MAMIAMATPPHNTAFREYPYEPIRPSIQSQSQESDSKAVALPSIRQAIPELHLSIPATDSRSKRASPVYSGPGPAPHSPDYVYSPTSKRRKLEEEYASVNTSQSQSLPPRRYSPGPRSHPDAPRSPRGQAYYASPRNAPAPSIDYHDRGHRGSLPSLSASIPYERDSGRAGARDDYNSHAPLTSSHKPHHYGQDSYSYSHGHSAPYGSPSRTGPYERAPFSSGYANHYHDAGRYGNEMGILGMGPDGKQRKRRGNLPKETTDKLRAWFVAHLTHPYPTEDEKQDLMRQTGLQMNQISNWFINARRRQLPAMMNNARAETDAMSRSSGSHSSTLDGKSHPLSDGEVDGYDDDRSAIPPYSAASYKRESV